MEEAITGFMEFGIIGGAFLFTLYHIVTKFSANLEEISMTLVSISTTLMNLNNNMVTMDERVARLESHNRGKDS